jgi:flagellar hook-basal body complex protein FliE
VVHAIQNAPARLDVVPSLDRGAAPAAAPGFESVLADAIESVDADQRVAHASLADLGAGKDVDLHGVMIALEEADITLRAMVAVRDKCVAAYEQILNMAV